jgi:nanoRNase/pAp phosphatase (c-di-AMP/oligoRNAs hydrolase)
MEEQPEIAQILLPHRGEKHVVVLHDYPDPDAIASAYAHKLISAQFGIDTDIFYTGEISHHQNLALVKLLAIQMIQYSPGQEMGGYQAAVFLDHQGTTVEQLVCALEEANVPVLLIIDHHQPQERLKPEFLILRETGSIYHLSSVCEGAIGSMLSGRACHAGSLMHGIPPTSKLAVNNEDFRQQLF